MVVLPIITCGVGYFGIATYEGGSIVAVAYIGFAVRWPCGMCYLVCSNCFATWKLLCAWYANGIGGIKF